MKKNKKIFLSKKNKKILGVAQALANYFEVDPTLVRVVFVFLAVLGGLPGLLSYVALWFIIPEEN